MIIREQIENAYSILIQSTENATRKARLKEELNWIKNQSDEVVNGYKFALNSVNEYDTTTPKKIVLAIRTCDHTKDDYPIMGGLYQK